MTYVSDGSSVSTGARPTYLPAEVAEADVELVFLTRLAPAAGMAVI